MQKNWNVLLVLCILTLNLSGCQHLEPTELTPKPTNTPEITSTPSLETTQPSVISSETPTQSPTLNNLPDWWKTAIFYEIFVRSFYDSNMDGVGDIRGVIDKLDYLNDGNPATNSDLGVTALWLMPIMNSPSTHGYDVIDYYSVNPQYGTMDDLKELLQKAHQRGMHVILDLPINHTSSQNSWFIQSQDVSSPFRDWYIWSATDPGYLGPWNQVVWHPLNGEYFYGFFWEGMPDLNYRNPAVTEEMQKIIKYWVNDVGVDGFRLDAIGSLIESGIIQIDTPETHKWLQNFYQTYKENNPATFMVGEVWSKNEVVVPYIRNHEVDLAFNFDLSSAIIQGINEGNPLIIKDVLEKSEKLFPEGLFGAFVTNHDMDRAVTQLGGNLLKAKAAASVYFTIPKAVPFIYYGEEIGMSGLAPDDQCRLPMQWSSSKNAGFSLVTPWKPVQEDYGTINVSSEQDNVLSLLSHYKKLISLRNENEVLQKGNLFANISSNPSLYSVTLVYQNKAILVLVNFSPKTIKGFSISQPSPILKPGTHTLTDLFGSQPNSEITIDKTQSIINFQPIDQITGYGTIILEIE